MQAESDAHKLGLALGLEGKEPSPAVAAAHGHLVRFAGKSEEAATALLQDGGEELAVEIVNAVTEARHVGAAGIRRALDPLLAQRAARAETEGHAKHKKARHHE